MSLSLSRPQVQAAGWARPAHVGDTGHAAPGWACPPEPSGEHESSDLRARPARGGVSATGLEPLDLPTSQAPLSTCQDSDEHGRG